MGPAYSSGFPIADFLVGEAGCFQSFVVLTGADFVFKGSHNFDTRFGNPDHLVIGAINELAFFGGRLPQINRNARPVVLRTPRLRIDVRITREDKMHLPRPRQLPRSGMVSRRRGVDLPALLLLSISLPAERGRKAELS